MPEVLVARPPRPRYLLGVIHQPPAHRAPFHGVRAVLGSSRQISRAAWRVLAATGAAAAAVLVVFHGWLFWDRLVSGRLFEGDAAARWLVGALLCAALWVLKRQGVSLWRGRQACTVWLLVVLLHAWSAAAVPAERYASTPAQEASASLLLPTAGALAGLTLLLLASRRAHSSPLSRFHFRSPLSAPLAATRCHGPARVPRAPPVSLA